MTMHEILYSFAKFLRGDASSQYHKKSASYVNTNI